MGQKKLPEIQSQEVVAKSRLFTVEALHLKFSNGAERDYERMKGSGRGAVMVIPINSDKQMLLISEYSAGTHNYELGFPKGLIDPGESVEQAANRELMEEIGFGAKTLIPLKEVALAPGYFDAKMTILMAFDLYPNKLEGDEPEPLELVPWSIDEIDVLIDNMAFSEARSVAGLLLAQRWLVNNAR